MTRPAARLILAATLCAVGSTAHAANPGGPATLEGSFVLDGGDLEAPSPALPDGPGLRASADSVAARSETQPPPTAARPMAFEYSDGYRTRLKIHKYASYATLPLFVSQYFVGQKLYDGNASDGTRSAHGALAASTAVLFGVNTVTGVWNLYEGRKDPTHRKKRLAHGLLMLAADAGFVATGALAPDDDEEGEGGGGNRSTHRSVALASMGVATVAYLIMLIGN